MLKNIIEALIFASGNGLPIIKISESLKEDYTVVEVQSALDKLRSEYNNDRGILIIEADGILQFQTNPIYGGIISDILLETREREISKTLLQVLAIIAYKQPITKVEIEELRGVNSDYVIAMLIKLDLIDAVGRKETIGRPILYGTTLEFLRKFGIRSLSDLPDYDDLILKIKNTFERYYAKTSDLYRDSSKSKSSAEVSKDKSKADFSAEDGLPEFLQGEDVIEVE